MTLWPMTRVQADDVIASAALQYSDHVERIVICSSDQDFCQCLNDKISLWNRSRRTVQTAEDVRPRYGVQPARFAEYLALVGDGSDGLPGVPEFVQKTTAALLNRYPNVEAIITATGEWSGDIRGVSSMVPMLLERRDEAILYRDLSILRTDVPLHHHMDDLRWRELNRSLLLTLTQLIEDVSVLPRLNRWQRLDEPFAVSGG